MSSESRPGFGEAVRLWLKIGCLGFGGPSGQIALLHRETVERRRWIGEEEFVLALKFCMLLPGPEAQQLATWIGWRLHGIRGGIAAGTLFVLPAALLIWVLGLLYVMGRDWPLLPAFFRGIQPVVVAIVAVALLRIGLRTVTSLPLGIIALAAFVLFQLDVPYPAVVIGAGILGWILFPKREEAVRPDQPDVHGKMPRIVFGAVVIWFLPVAALLLWLGPGALPARIALFFAQVAVLSFGGAYAALSYVSLHAASDWGWITRGEMLDGLGLAETTPGPLLIALQFVAFLACYKAPGALAPLLSATIGSLAAVWSLFLPSFLWIFSLAPHMERIAGNRRMAGALSSIGAVVAAVIAALALRFASGVLFLKTSGGIAVRPIPLLCFLVALMLLQGKRIGMIPLILFGGVAGILLRVAGAA